MDCRAHAHVPTRVVVTLPRVLLLVLASLQLKINLCRRRRSQREGRETTSFSMQGGDVATFHG